MTSDGVRPSAPILPAAILKLLVEKRLLSTSRRRSQTGKDKGTSHPVSSLHCEALGKGAAKQNMKHGSLLGTGSWEDAERTFNRPKGCLIRSLLRY